MSSPDDTLAGNAAPGILNDGSQAYLMKKGKPTVKFTVNKDRKVF
jgi:hypothetical protein